MATLLYVPHMAARVRANPWLFSMALANMLAIANIPREIPPRQRLAGVSLLVRRHDHADGRCSAWRCSRTWSSATPNPAHSLDIYNAASSPKTLGIMLIIAAIGVPVVLAYTVSIYWIFRGKVKLDRMSY